MTDLSRSKPAGTIPQLLSIENNVLSVQYRQQAGT
jgi:hypothetical protein